MDNVARFSLRDLVYITTIVALVVALFMTWQKVPEPAAVIPGSIPAGVPRMSISGPIFVAGKERLSDTATSSFSGVELNALHFMDDDSVIFEYPDGRYKLYDSSRMSELSWKAE